MAAVRRKPQHPPSHDHRSRTPNAFTSRGRLAWHLAVCLLVVALTPSMAHAAGPRPYFQMPVACGQTWEASTYTGHWPDQDSIDLGQWSPSDANISKGEPVLASAAGKVLDVFTSPDGDIRVYLDHGNGWVTHYIHLEQTPPLAVGQLVAQGEQIGRVGNSGTEQFHLHYTQLEDGNAVRIQFNGKSINTHAGNPSSYDTWGNGEKLTSANCAGNSFLEVNQDGGAYQLLYKPGTGALSILLMDGGGNGASSVSASTFTQRWTHFTPFKIGGKPYYFAYRSSTGEVQFTSVLLGGFGLVTVGLSNFGTGWTHFMPFTLSGKPYYIAYNSLYGNATLNAINANGTGSSMLWSGTWGSSWTHLVPFRLDGVQYFIAYQAGSGHVEIDKVASTRNGIAITEVWSGAWTKNWSQIVPLVHNGAVHLLKYKAHTGLVSFEKINAAGAGTQGLGTQTWDKSWTAFSPYAIDGQAHVLIYKAGAGTAKVVKLSPDGSAMSIIWTGAWTTGWS